MSQFSVTSRCECQAVLQATLDEHRHVVSGTATRTGDREIAPAISMGATGERFDIGWACPFCGRNTMRTFDAAALKPVRAAS